MRHFNDDAIVVVRWQLEFMVLRLAPHQPGAGDRSLRTFDMMESSP